MEHQIQTTIVSEWCSEHQLFVEGELFIEKKESEEDLHDVVRISHSRQIGDKFYKICQTQDGSVDKDGGKLTEEEVETNLETEEEINEFKSAWESGWQPTLNQAYPMDFLHL